MIRNIKKSKGITLISMILTIIVLLIIVGTISYSSRNSLQKKKLDNFFNDIDTLSDAVSVYYIKNGKLPVYYSKYDINGNSGEYREICLDNTYLNIPEFDYDDISSYYILDITKLEDISLNNSNNIPERIETGNFFSKDADKENLENSISSTNKGIFIVNSLSHVVYYTNGIKVDGNTYYTKNIDYSKIPTFSKNDKNSVEEDIINAGENANKLEENKLRIVFWANGGTNAPDDIIVSKSNKGNSKDSLGYTLTNGSQGVGEPIKLGMKFVGWAEEEKGSVKYKYELSKSQNHVYKQYSVENGFTDTKFSEYPETVINLYAVWEQDISKIFKCYYPAGTGGIKPDMSNNSVKRTGQVEAVSYPICIDIPSSGYTISWTWENGSNDIQQAKYVGDSTTTTLELETTTYETTEPGSIQLVGSFLELIVYINDKTTGRINIVLDENGKDVNFYKADTGEKDKAVAKATVGSKDAVWMTGNDGQFTVPSNPKTYSALGVVDPERGTNYTVEGKNSNFYLKSAILTDSTNLENVSYNEKIKELGSVVDISKDGDEKQYCLYPRFGSRNYKIVDDENHVYYHENLQEAYNHFCELQNSGKNCSSIVLMRDVYRSLTSGEDKPIDEKYYVKNYDPTYDKAVEFASNNIVVDFANHTITREGAINLSNNVQLTTKSSNSGINEQYGLIFKKSNEGIKLVNESKLYLLGGISLKSEDGVVIGLYDKSKFYGIYGLVENTSLNNQNAIKSTSDKTNICLGISKDELDEIDDNISVSDNNLTIKTQSGFAINTEGKIYWKAGILKTKDIAKKQGYNDNALVIVPKRAGENNKKEPCIAYDTENSEIKIRLGKRDWEWKDDDSGTSKTYYSANLQNANNSLNLKNTSKSYTIKWLHPVANSGEYNDATITKRMIIDFNCFNSNTPNFNNSLLTIDSKDVMIKNLHCETTKGIQVKKDSSLNIEECFIGANAPGVNAITNSGKIIYKSSETNRCGFYTKSTGSAINNKGDITYNIGISDKDKIYTEGSGKAIYNDGDSKNRKATFKYIGNSSPSNFIYSSENSSADYVVYNGTYGYMEYVPGQNGILEAKNTSTKTICRTLDNAGEFICSMGTIRSASTYTSNNHTIRNTKLFKLCGTANIQSNYMGIYNYGTSAISCIYDEAKIESKGYGINTNNGKVYVASQITINNDNSISLSNNSNILSGPEITGESRYGIYVSNVSGMLTLGANESPVSVSKISPVIKSNNGGVYIGKNSKFNFYDGVIKGKESSITGGITSTPENYAVGKMEENISGNTYKIAVLGPSKPTITAKLNNSSGTSYESGTWTNQNVYISLSSSKIGAGIKEYQWYENGKWVTRALTTKNNKGTITYRVNRNETLRFRTIDNNGVISEESTITVRIDKTK